MNANKIRESEMIEGARFEISSNDPNNLGSLIWLPCTVVATGPTNESTTGVPLFTICRDGGSPVFCDLASLRRVRQ